MSCPASLLVLLKEGDVPAFTELYHMYSEKIYLNILRMVKDELAAEEIVQILFSKIWRNRESISCETDFEAYLYRAAANLVCDFYRKLKNDRKLMANFKATITEQYSHIEEFVSFKERSWVLEQAMAGLSPRQRHVYQLCTLDGYSYKDVAEKLSISPHTVKEYLGKARQSVRAFMERNVEIIACFAIFIPPILAWRTVFS